MGDHAVKGDDIYGDPNKRLREVHQQTSENTNASWLKNTVPDPSSKLIADTDHIRKYGNKMMDLSTNSSMNFTRAFGEPETPDELPQPGGEFPEGVLLRTIGRDNKAKLGYGAKGFMQDLSKGLACIGHGSFALADIYDGTDADGGTAINNASINDVRYVFGDAKIPGSDVHRPAGLPDSVNTYMSDHQQGAGNGQHGDGHGAGNEHPGTPGNDGGHGGGHGDDHRIDSAGEADPSRKDLNYDGPLSDMWHHMNPNAGPVPPPNVQQGN